jgi:hypothetical protein
MDFEGETYTVSQNLDPHYLGVYVKNEGQRKWQYGLYSEAQKNKSFYLEQTLSDPSAIKYEWNLDNKQIIQWGVVVDKQGQARKIKISEVKNGEMREFEAMMILIENQQTKKVESAYLYEHQNAIYLGYAVKVSEIASSGGQK